MATLKLPPGTQITMPNGKRYTTGPQAEVEQPVTRLDVQKALEDSATTTAVGKAVLKEAEKRREVIKALEEAADRWDAAALAQPSRTSEVGRIYKAKAASARARAQQLREEK